MCVGVSSLVRFSAMACVSGGGSVNGISGAGSNTDLHCRCRREAAAGWCARKKNSRWWRLAFPLLF